MTCQSEIGTLNKHAEGLRDRLSVLQFAKLSHTKISGDLEIRLKQLNARQELLLGLLSKVS